MPTSTQVTPQPGSGLRVGPWILLVSVILGPQLSLVQGTKVKNATQLCPHLVPTAWILLSLILGLRWSFTFIWD